jgi:hypothetical protein
MFFVTHILFATLQVYMEANGGALPTVQECLDARDPRFEWTAESRDIYQWLWMHCFPAAAHRKNWGKSYYLDKTPSASMPGYEKHHAYVSIPSEAYFLVQLESNHARWTLWYQRVMINGEKLSQSDIRNDEQFKSKYALPFNGQEKFKGFSEEGLERFEELKKLVKANRVRDLQEAMDVRPNGTPWKRIVFMREQQMLAYLQDCYKSKVKSSKKNSKRKKKTEEQVANKRICSRDVDGSFDPKELYEQRRSSNPEQEDDDDATVPDEY